MCNATQSVCVYVCEAAGVCPAQQQWLVAISARIVNCALQQPVGQNRDDILTFL